MINVKLNMLNGARQPEYQSDGAAGADLYSFLNENITIHPGHTALIPTGIFLEIPAGYEAQVRPRSGLALNNGITLLNSPGTIDSDYRGEVKIIVTNFGAENFIVTNHMRIAQMVFCRVYRGVFDSGEPEHTKRGQGGFGHSGLL